MKITSVIAHSSAIAIATATFPAAAQSTGAGAQAARPSATPAPPSQATPPATTGDPATAPTATEPAAVQDVAAQNEGGEIVVTGIRRSLQSAQALKQNSEASLDAVNAEDIGKLPDNNVSEALARVTGVQVSRSGDEANQVVVRGLPDLTTTFNGREIFTGDGRNVALQDFPAGAIAGLEVYKSTTANLIEGGIAGLINVRSRRPFDIDGFQIAGAFRESYNDQSRYWDPNGNILISNRWETGIGEIGALINASYTQTHFLTSARFDDGFIVTPGDNPRTEVVEAQQPVTTPGVGNFNFPTAVGIFYARGKRWRPSINGAVQWRPTPDLEIYAEGLWQGYRARESNDFIGAVLRRDNNLATLSNVVLSEDDPTKAQSLTATGGAPVDLFAGFPTGDTNTYQGAIGATYTAGRAKFSTDFAYTNTKFTLIDYGFDTTTADSPVRNVNFQVPSDYGVEWDLGGYDLSNPNNFIVRGIFDRRFRTKGKSIQWRGDLQLDTDISFIPRIDFGARYVDRDSGADNSTRYADLRALAIRIPDTPAAEGGLIRPGFRGSDIQPVRQWFAPFRSTVVSNIDALRQFARDGIAKQLEADPTNQDLLTRQALYASPLPVYNPLERFRANEKSYTVYGQFRYEFDLLFPIDGVIGVRAINTVTSLSGTSLVNNQQVPVGQEQNYVDVLPNANARVNFTDKLQLRVSATKTRSRPAFGQLNPALNISRDLVNPLAEFGGNSGNINLKPIESTNYDASLEWYFSKTGSVTAAVFRRDINGFIITQTNRVTDPIYGRINLSRPENAGDGKIQGVEAAFTTFFDSLPGFLSGFGTQLNFTYIDGSQALQSVSGVEVPDVDIPNVSKYSYNLVALYEKGPISARLAYNYRSKWVNFFDNSSQANPVAGEYTRPVERLDFSGSITPIEQVTLTFDVTNITGKPFENVRNFSDTQSFPRDVRYEGRIYSLGARFRF